MVYNKLIISYCMTCVDCNLLLCQDQTEQSSMGQVELVQDSLTGRQVVLATNSTPESLCYHKVIPVDVQDLACSLVDAITSQLLPTRRAGQSKSPQVVGHPYQKPVVKEAVWRWSLVVDERRDQWLIPELQVCPKSASVKKRRSNPPLIL